MVSKTLKKTDSYSALVKAVRAQISKGQAVIERQQVITYWNVGKDISDYILKGGRRAGYGQQVFERLSKDLNLSVRTLERIVRFHREFSISTTGSKLRWSHYRTLLAVKDPSKRLELQQKIVKKGLSTEQLQAEINAYRLVQSREKILTSPQTVPRLSVVRGQLFYYKTISPASKAPEARSVVIDCGFNFWREIPRNAQGLTSGTMISTRKEGERYRITVKTPPGGEQSLYTYKAYLERVIDGDTIWLNIDVGFRNFSRQKVRFNRIDAPEITTGLGVKAKRFVEQALSSLDFLVIKTYKYDKYARYLVDIFYLPGEADPQTVADKGTMLNQELLNRGLARGWGAG